MNFKIIVFLISTLVIAACNKTESGPAKSKEELDQIEIQNIKNFASVDDYMTKLLPQSYSMVRSNIDYKEQSKFYNHGCKTEGSYSPVFKIEPLLKSGHIFIADSAYARLEINKSTNFKFTNENIISYIDDKKIVKHINYNKFYSNNFPFTDVSQIFSRLPHMIYETTYIFKADESYPEFDFKVSEANYTDQAMNWIRNNSTSTENQFYLSCSVEYNINNYKSSYDQVELNFNNKIVSALVNKNTKSGLVTCKKYKVSKESKSINSEDKPLLTINLGEGVDESVSISTNDVLSDSLFKCGGIKIYSANRLVLSDGRVVKSDVQKILSAPVR
jgi:hypothetical protein